MTAVIFQVTQDQSPPCTELICLRFGRAEVPLE